MSGPGQIACRILGSAPQSARLICETPAMKVFQIDRGGTLFRRNSFYDYFRHVLIHIILNNRTKNLYLMPDDASEPPPRIRQIKQDLWQIGPEYCCLDSDLQECLYCGNWMFYHAPNPIPYEEAPRFEGSSSRVFAEFVSQQQADLVIIAAPDEDTIWVAASSD